MQVCYTAVLIQRGNQFTTGLVREHQTACGGREHSRRIYGAGCAQLQGWKQKLGVLERIQLAGLTAFGLWAQSVSIGDMQAAQGAPWSALCAGDAPSLPQSAIAVPNPNAGLGLHELRSSAAQQVH